MSDLRGGRAPRTNSRIEAELLSRDIDSGEREMDEDSPFNLGLEGYDDVTTLDPNACDDVTFGWWGWRPRMPWEVLP